MKKIIFSIIILISGMVEAQVGIGTTTPNSSAILDVTSTNKGFLPPRMDNIQMNAITSPVEGLVVYCNNCTPKGLFIYSGTSWTSLQPDATTTTKGSIQLAGDLAGTSASPTVPGLALLASQISSAQTTANNALTTADAAVGFSTIYANTYIASTSTDVSLPGYTSTNVASGTNQIFAVSRDNIDDKKYFNFPIWNSGGKFKYLFFNNFKSDTKYAGMQIRAKKTLPFGCLLRVVPNANASNTFSSTGFNYLYVAIANHPSDFAYTSAFTVGSGDGTATATADGTSANANVPKVVIYAFDSKAALASYRTLSVSTINTVTHPNFGTSGAASEFDIRYAIVSDGAYGRIIVSYKNINDSNWTTLYSYSIPTATTLGSELNNGGKAGFAFGLGNRGNTTGMQDIKISSLTPLSLD